MNIRDYPQKWKPQTSEEWVFLINELKSTVENMNSQLTDYKDQTTQKKGTWNRARCIYSKNQVLKNLRLAKLEYKKFKDNKAIALLGSDSDLELVKEAYAIIVSLAHRLNWQGFDPKTINKIDSIKTVLRENGYENLY